MIRPTREVEIGERLRTCACGTFALELTKWDVVPIRCAGCRRPVVFVPNRRLTTTGLTRFTRPAPRLRAGLVRF